MHNIRNLSYMESVQCFAILAADRNTSYLPLLNSFNRARLTMHTAFERKDNADPAAVTALSVSRDHRTVYVGDEKGRVWSWAVSSKPGKGK